MEKTFPRNVIDGSKDTNKIKQKNLPASHMKEGNEYEYNTTNQDLSHQKKEVEVPNYLVSQAERLKFTKERLKGAISKIQKSPILKKKAIISDGSNPRYSLYRFYSGYTHNNERPSFSKTHEHKERGRREINQSFNSVNIRALLESSDDSEDELKNHKRRDRAKSFHNIRESKFKRQHSHSQESSMHKNDDSNNRDENQKDELSNNENRLRIIVGKKGKLRNYYKPKSLILLPDDLFKNIWSIFLSIVLIYTLTITPYRISFFEEDSLVWAIIDETVTGIFILDIIFNFFSAYFDSNENLIMSKKKIARRYLTSWFIVDIIGILPINHLFSIGDYNQFMRFSRLPRLYRLMKLTKMLRMLKMVKERNMMVSYLNDILNLSPGTERLFYFVVIFLIICHISSCLWHLITRIEEDHPSWVIYYNFEDCSRFEIYVSGLYFTISTFTNVGLGDIVAQTTTERFYSMFLMLGGVCGYAFGISSFTTLISSIDSKKAKLNEKLGFLNEIKKEYNLDTEIYMRLRKALKYYHDKSQDNHAVLKKLPQNLKMELSYIIHQAIVQKIPFFQNQMPQFVASIGPLLRPVQIMKNEYIYEEGDPINEIYFLIKGEVGFVLKNFSDAVYVTVEEGQYFGEIDFLVSSDYENRGHRRHFSVKALEDSEVLILSRDDFMKLYLEFPEILNKLLERGEKVLSKSQEMKKKAETFFRKMAEKGLSSTDTINSFKEAKYWKSLKDIEEEKNEKEEVKESEVIDTIHPLTRLSAPNIPIHLLNSVELGSPKANPVLSEFQTSISNENPSHFNLLDRLKETHSKHSALSRVELALKREFSTLTFNFHAQMQVLSSNISNLKNYIMKNKDEKRRKSSPTFCLKGNLNQTNQSKNSPNYSSFEMNTQTTNSIEESFLNIEEFKEDPPIKKIK